MKTEPKYHLWMITLSVILTLVSCKPKPVEEYGNKLGEIQEKADPVKTEGQLVETGEFPLELVSNGKLEASNKASLLFKHSDIIEKIHVKNGQWVNKGDSIANLVTKVKEINLKQAETAIERARISYMDMLLGYNSGSDNEMTVSPLVLENLKVKSGLRDAELNLKVSKLDYNDCFLIAPISGRVTSLETKEYNLPPSGKPVCVIIDDREFEVVFPVMESELREVVVGQEVTVKPFAYDSLSVLGRITNINPVVDEHGMVKIKATIPNHSHLLVEGMNIKVFIRYKVNAELIIPKEALVLRNNRQVVFSLKNGRSSWNYVHTGYENSSHYTITMESGDLMVGDTIITKGNLNLAHDAILDFTFNEK